MKTMHDELHDVFITGVQYQISELAFSLVQRVYSPEARDLVDSRNSRLVFEQVADIDAQKVRGRSLLTRRIRLYKTTRELLSAAKDWLAIGESIALIETVEDGFVLHTHLSGEFYIKASKSQVEDLVEV